ncbi:hypothetical protein DOTSEDRAFT_170248 [Dothistroma septosporum NZE10]|uniref:Uncharacterized protein n=1 Tax=Dothistroma septosporum (strain NZE10 / CBS 128990) TaxID=675120 RepID=N1PQ72_DOTSN|nr:hypothetical protein DOTSEDRAFT_170248 [Dothistroma septosporum NZE10]
MLNALSRQYEPMAPLTGNGLDHGSGIWSSVRITPSSAGNCVERYGWGTDSLRPHSRYRKLLRERLGTTSHVISTANGTFLSLSAELRNTIYRLILVPAPGYIDYAPKTTLFLAGNHRVRKQQLNEFKTNILPALHLLRLNKQIRAEAASIFYGENEFRFTNVKGWYVMDTWLRQIGPYNQSLVRKIAVHVPWRGDVLDESVDALPESNKRLERMQIGLRNMGLKPRTYWRSFGRDRCVRRTARIVESHRKLVQFRLIVPDSFAPIAPLSAGWQKSDNVCYDFVLDPTKLENLNVQLVRLHGGFEGKNGWCKHGCWVKYMQADRAQALVEHLPAREQAVQRGVELIDMVYDKDGHYPVPLAEGDKILDMKESVLRTAYAVR